MPRPDRSRQRLLSTTIRMVRRQGYAATGLQQVLTTSGASGGSLYHHFPGGKEELVAAALVTAVERITADLAALLADHDAVTAVGSWLDVYTDAIRRDPRDGCPVAPVAMEAISASPQLTRLARDAFTAWVQLLAARLEIDGHTPERAATAALTAVSAVEGALLIGRTQGDGAALVAVRAMLPALLRPDS
jgi:TetR/AcrR family transcriptional repressor of lmrAB and yxaGH operons